MQAGHNRSDIFRAVKTLERSHFLIGHVCIRVIYTILCSVQFSIFLVYDNQYTCHNICSEHPPYSSYKPIKI